MTKRTYIGSTLYHIYMSILHMVKESKSPETCIGENVLFLVESTPQIETLIPSLKKRFFREVYMVSERKDHVRDLGKWKYSFRRKSALPPYYEEKHPFVLHEAGFLNDSTFFLCDVDSSKTYFLYKYGHKDFHMIEDGARTYIQRHTNFEGWVKKNITKTPIGGGYDKEVLHVYAQFPEKLPLEIRKKALRLNIKEETQKMPKSIKQALFQVFMSQLNVSIPNKKTALILTQPLSEDKVVKDEKTKIDIYKDLISKLDPSFHAVLKIHPRETTDYSNHFKDITLLPALFPIEVLSLQEGFNFEAGYTLFSTALLNMEMVKETHFMGKDYLSYFTSKKTRELVEHMKEQ